MGFRAKIVAMAAALLAFAGATAVAQAPDPIARDLAQRLARAEVELVEAGYARAAGPFADAAEAHAPERFTITLRAGRDYRIVGVCETRCTALGMNLIDPNGQLVARDVVENGVPVMHVRPRTTGPHTVEVSVQRCAGPECWYAFNVYSR